MAGIILPFPMENKHIFSEEGKGVMRVSYICPQCNGMLETAPSCPRCGQFMEDNGRIMDLFDDYSPYLEIEGTKLVDGLPDDAKNHKCPHVFACPGCGERTQQLFDEVYYS